MDMGQPALRVVSNKLPAPPYAANTKTKGWRFELDLQRVWKSDTWALCPPDMRPWLYQVWAVAFEQEPAGSLPSDYNLISAHIGMDSRTFTVNAEFLLRGFVLHSDNRLYHPVVSERVMKLIEYRDLERERKAKYRNKLKNKETRPTGQTRDRRGIPEGETLQEQEQEQELDNLPSEDNPPSEDLSPDASGDDMTEESKDKIPPCPHGKIIDLYHRHLPMLPVVIRSEWTSSPGAKRLRTIWRQNPRHRQLDFWVTFFETVKQKPWWLGESNSGWQANFRWLLKPERFDEVKGLMATNKRRGAV